MANYQSWKPNHNITKADPKSTGWERDSVDETTTTISSHDHVGIGNVDPNEKLSVTGNVSSGDIIYDYSRSSIDWASVYQTVRSLSSDWSDSSPHMLDNYTLSACHPGPCSACEIIVPGTGTAGSLVNINKILSQQLGSTPQPPSGKSQTETVRLDGSRCNMHYTTIPCISASGIVVDFTVENMGIGQQLTCRVVAESGASDDDYAVLQFPAS